MMEGMSAEIAIVVGQGYVGLPLAMRAVAAGYDVVGYDVDEHRSKALAAGTSFVEDITDAEVAAALATGRYRAVSTSRASSASTSPSSPCPRRCGRASPTSPSSTRPASPARPAAHGRAPRWCSRAPPTPAPPRSASAPSSSEGSGLRAGADFHLGYSPERIDPGQPDLDARQHAEGRERHRRREPGQGRGLLRPDRRHHRAGVDARRRPSSPSSSRTRSGT